MLEVLERIRENNPLEAKKEVKDPLNFLCYSIRNKILNQVFSEIPDTQKSKHELQRLVGIAWVDMIYIVALYINSDIDKNILLWILHKNMKYGWAMEHNTLYEVIKSSKKHIKQQEWDKVIAKLEKNSQICVSHFYEKLWVDKDGMAITPHSLDEIPGAIMKQEKEKTVCPFGVIKWNHQWIEIVWDFLEFELIPQLQKKTPTGLWYQEDFFTGRLHAAEKL